MNQERATLNQMLFKLYQNDSAVSIANNVKHLFLTFSLPLTNMLIQNISVPQLSQESNESVDIQQNHGTHSIGAQYFSAGGSRPLQEG